MVIISTLINMYKAFLRDEMPKWKAKSEIHGQRKRIVIVPVEKPKNSKAMCMHKAGFLWLVAEISNLSKYLSSSLNNLILRLGTSNFCLLKLLISFQAPYCNAYISMG